MNRAEALAHVAKLTTEDRNLTHGDPIAQFETAQQLKDELARGPRWMDLNAVQRESLEQICTKLSRAVHGNPLHLDTYLDIIGYSAIAVESIQEYNETASTRHETYLPDDGAAIIAKRFAPRHKHSV